MEIIYIYITALLFALFAALVRRQLFFLEIVIFTIVIYLLGRGAQTLDIINYYVTFNSSIEVAYSETYEKGYLFLEKTFKRIGFSYIEFRYFLLLIIFSFYFKLFSFFKVRKSYLLFFYLFFSLFIDSVQFRNFFAFSFVLLGIRYLFEGSKKGVFTYVFCVVIASSIHISMFVYIVFAILGFRNYKNYVKVIVKGSIVLCVFIFLLGNKISLINNVFGFISSAERLDGYRNSATKLGFVYPFILHLMGVLVMYLIRKKVNFYKYEFNVSEVRIIDLIFFTYLLSIVFFPLYMSNLQFIRLSRNLLILSFLGYSIYKDKFLIKDSLLLKVDSVNVAFCLMLFSWFYFTFVIQGHIDDIIVPFFDNKTIS